MDHDLFDALSRHLAAAASRRGLLAHLMAGVLATSPLAFGDAAVAKSCPPCRRKKRGKCKKKRPNGTPCPHFGTCQGGQCVPPFCAGKNFCLIGEDAGRCDRGGIIPCLCTVTEATGAPFCGQFVRVPLEGGCDGCTAEETCVDSAGPFCGVGVACASPCPNAR